jgi:predicted ATPase
MEAALRLFRGEPEVALQRAQEAETAATEQRIASLINPDILRGRALVTEGVVAEGLELIEKGGGAAGGLFGVFYRPYHLAVVSETLCCAGDYDGAAAALAEAAAAMEKSSERWWQAEIERLGGVLLLARRNIAESAARFERALRVAREQQAKSLELRAATSLARLWGEQGRRVEAHDLLAPVYGWFTEGFDTADLKNAKALLSELA